MQRILAIVLLSVMTLLLSASTKPHQEKNKIFEERFSNWTKAFNQKDLPAVCELFSKNMTASYQGYTVKNYTSLCDGFKKIFNEPRQYVYSYRIRHVYLTDELAAVRITWFLRITENGKQVSDTQDEGMDIFKKNKHGAWVIVSYLGYPHAGHAK